ncbi:MAG: hypothetical protein JG766_1307, partial [Desulfacinum sp.]|nr:hypothetical protein [Desulfacinum sp.]
MNSANATFFTGFTEEIQPRLRLLWET